jgi:hypothetical protein
MDRSTLLPTVVVVVLSLSSYVCAQAKQSSPESAENSARIEVQKLLRSLEGNWNVFENFPKSEFFPKGGARTGTAKITPGPGRLSLVEDYHSNGSAGKLDLLAVIWWDGSAQVYRPLICANDGEGCVIRGTVRWQGNTLINDYDEVIGGKKRKMRDSFVDISPTSFTLIAAVFTQGSEWQTIITTRYKRP